MNVTTDETHDVLSPMSTSNIEMIRHAYGFNESEYYSFKVSMDGFVMAYWTEDNIAIGKRRENSLLPYDVARDTLDHMYFMGLLMETQCRQKHTHNMTCKPTILCCSCVLNQICDNGFIACDPDSRGYIQKGKMEVCRCPTPTCPGVICKRCAELNSYISNDGTISLASWICPLCHSKTLNWPDQARYKTPEIDFGDSSHVLWGAELTKVDSIKMNGRISLLCMEILDFEEGPKTSKEDKDEYDIIHIGVEQPEKPIIHVEVVSTKKKSKQCVNCLTTETERWMKWPNSIEFRKADCCKKCYKDEAKRIRSGKQLSLRPRTRGKRVI